MDRKKAYVLAITGAACWGLIGLFVQPLYAYGLSAWNVVAIRVISSGLLMIVYLGAFNPKLLKIRWQDTVFFVGTGILSIVFFNWCYFKVINQVSLSLAVTLLYTGPMFVTVMSYLLFKEKLSKMRIIALLVTLIGCGFVVGLFPGLKVNMSWSAVLIGLASGFCYALYSIFGKYISGRYSTMTITTYSFVFASLFMVPTGGLWKKIDVVLTGDVLLLSLGLALIPTCLAYILYTYGLSLIESSRASILATIEPVVAIIIGVLVFRDHLSYWQGAGMLCILVAILMTTGLFRRKRNDAGTTSSVGTIKG